MQELNANFSAAVVEAIPPDDISSEVVLENSDKPLRTTSLQRITPGQPLTTAATGTELIVLEGQCSDHRQHYAKGHYLRTSGSITLTTDSECLLFHKAHQYIHGDESNRVIDTTAEHHWLPGPAPGILICPLHVFDSESIMLLRWEQAAELKPGLDPQGEEILVISGLLQNRDQLFKPYSWIRNPIEDWRSWHGGTGTLIYYKNGHFPKS